LNGLWRFDLLFKKTGMSLTGEWSVLFFSIVVKIRDPLIEAPPNIEDLL